MFFYEFLHNMGIQHEYRVEHVLKVLLPIHVNSLLGMCLDIATISFSLNHMNIVLVFCCHFLLDAIVQQ